jgi:hypothetical protein
MQSGLSDTFTALLPRSMVGRNVLMIRTRNLRRNFHARRSRLPAQIARGPGDSCGCAMGSRFLAIALVLASAWYVCHWGSWPLSVWAILLRVMAWGVLAAVVGKIVGMLTFKFQRIRALNIRHF